jgi:fatty acid elongase 3
MPDLFDLLPLHDSLSLPSHFTSWIPGETPFSTHSGVYRALLLYLAVVYGGKVIMKTQSPYSFTRPFQAHNLVLSWASLSLLFLIVREAAPVVYKRGLYDAMCAADLWNRVSIRFE